MQKVNIVDCPGSGKSTLARALARQTGLPVVHLDTLYHDPSHPYANQPVWRQRIEDIVGQPAWIIDGVHQTTYQSRFQAADLTIFLDLPMRICLWRVLARWIKLRKYERPDMPAGWRQRLGREFLNFILFVITYCHKERPAVYRALQRHAQGRYIVLHSSHEFAAFLQNGLTSSQPTAAPTQASLAESRPAA